MQNPKQKPSPHLAESNQKALQDMQLDLMRATIELPKQVQGLTEEVEGLKNAVAETENTMGEGIDFLGVIALYYFRKSIAEGLMTPQEQLTISDLFDGLVSEPGDDDDPEEQPLKN